MRVNRAPHPVLDLAFDEAPHGRAPGAGEPQQGTGGKGPVPAGPTVWLEEADDKQAAST